MKLFVNVVPISNLHCQAKIIGRLNSKTILCYVLVYCIILASRYNIFKLVKYFYSFMMFIFLLPLMLMNKDYQLGFGE